MISARPYKVFLYTTDDVRDRIKYVNDNPPKENLPPQRWDFVTAYDNFPSHKQAKPPARDGRDNR